MKCSICGLVIGKFGGSRGFGHNAQPINDGICCDDCNNLVVIERAIAMIKELKNDNARSTR